MVDTVINERRPAGIWSLLKEFIVHSSITTSQKPIMSGARKKVILTKGDTAEVDNTVAELELRSEDTIVTGEEVLPLLESATPVAASAGSAVIIGTLPRVNLKSIFSGAFRETYIFDGYDISSNKVVTAEAGEGIYEGNSIGHAILTFFGLPTRFEKFVPKPAPIEDNPAAVAPKATEPALLPIADDLEAVAPKMGNPPIQVPSMGGWQLLKNFFGGWYPLFDDNWKYIGGERGFWQIIATLTGIKLVIFAVKLATTVLRFALNIVKLATEFLPSVIVNGTGLLLNYSTTEISNTIDSSAHWGKKTLKFLGLGLVTLVLGIPHYVARIWLLAGKAFTSPETSARLAFDFGYSLEIEGYPRTTTFFRWVLGITGATLSISLTIALWAVALPFAVAGLAKVPQFMAIFNSLASSALISPAIGFVNGALTVISGYLAIFQPAVAALSALVGLTVTPVYLAVGATIAGFAGLLTPIASRLADGLSNWWAQRDKNSAPITWLLSLKGGANEAALAAAPDAGTELADMNPTIDNINNMLILNRPNDALLLLARSPFDLQTKYLNGDGSIKEDYLEWAAHVRRLRTPADTSVPNAGAIQSHSNLEVVQPSSDALRLAVVKIMAESVASKAAQAAFNHVEKVAPSRKDDFFGNTDPTAAAKGEYNFVKRDILQEVEDYKSRMATLGGSDD